MAIDAIYSNHRPSCSLDCLMVWWLLVRINFKTLSVSHCKTTWSSSKRKDIITRCSAVPQCSSFLSETWECKPLTAVCPTWASGDRLRGLQGLHADLPRERTVPGVLPTPLPVVQQQGSQTQSVVLGPAKGPWWVCNYKHAHKQNE